MLNEGQEKIIDIRGISMTREEKLAKKETLKFLDSWIKRIENADEEEIKRYREKWNKYVDENKEKSEYKE